MKIAVGLFALLLSSVSYAATDAEEIYTLLKESGAAVKWNSALYADVIKVTGMSCKGDANKNYVCSTTDSEGTAITIPDAKPLVDAILVSAPKFMANEYYFKQTLKSIWCRYRPDITYPYSCEIETTSSQTIQ